MGSCIDDSLWMENPCFDDAVAEKCSCINDTTRTVLFIHIYTSASIIKTLIQSQNVVNVTMTIYVTARN